MKDDRYFFKEGIKFECQKCGKCCTGSSGTIFVSKKEIKAISEFLNISQESFIKDYCYPYKNSYSIKEKPNGDCIFYDKGCLIYPVRPTQCKTYPFWVKNLRNKRNWEQTEKECKGIGKGKLYSLDEILEILKESDI